MKKEQLKSGDRLTLRNGDIGYLILENGISIVKGMTYNFDYYLDDLTDRWNGEEYDIVKVERIQVDFDALNKNMIHKINPEIDSPGSYAEYIQNRVNNNLSYRTIWERELTNLLKKDNKCVDLSKQPKKIEPLHLQDYGDWDDKVIANKLNKLIEIINKEVLK